MTFLTDLRSRERAAFSSFVQPGSKGIFDYLSPKEIVSLFKLVTDSALRDQDVMSEVLSSQAINNQQQQHNNSYEEEGMLD